MQILFFMYVAFSLLGMIIAIPMMTNRLKPNPFYGFRVRETLEDSRLWYAVNQYFGVRLFIISLTELIVTLVLYFFIPLSLDVYARSVLGVYVVTFGLAFAQTLRYMKSIKQKSAPDHE